MRIGTVALMLVYEPTSAHFAPVPLIRVSDDALTVAVADYGIFQAEARARDLSARDELLGEMEFAEVRRLREVLSLLVPGFGKQQQPHESKIACHVKGSA